MLEIVKQIDNTDNAEGFNLCRIHLCDKFGIDKVVCLHNKNGCFQDCFQVIVAE